MISMECEITRQPNINEHEIIQVVTTTQTITDETRSCSVVKFNYMGTNIIYLYQSPPCRIEAIISSIDVVICALGGSKTIEGDDFNTNFACQNIASNDLTLALAHRR